MTKNRCWDRGSAPPASPPKNRSLLRAMKAASAWQPQLENLHSKMLNDCPFTVGTVYDFYVEVESWRPACGGCREIQLMVDVVGVCRMDCTGTVRSSSKWWEAPPIGQIWMPPRVVLPQTPSCPLGVASWQVRWTAGRARAWGESRGEAHCPEKRLE